MKIVNVPAKYMARYEGKWVAIVPKTQTIIAVGDTLEDIAPLVSGHVKDKDKVQASAFKVPTKEEAHYHIYAL